MLDINGLSGFIAAMPGESAEVSKDVLQRIERDLRAGRAAIAQLQAARAITGVCARIAGVVA